MTDDLVERLRVLAPDDRPLRRDTMREAATALSEARAEIERLRSELDIANTNHRQMAKQLADLGRDLEEAVEVLRLVDHVRGTAEDTAEIAKMIQDFVKEHEK